MSVPLGIVAKQRRLCIVAATSYKKGFLRNFPKFRGKHLYQSLFLNKVAGLCNFIKKETLTQVFSSEFHKIAKSTFFTENI